MITVVEVRTKLGLAALVALPLFAASPAAAFSSPEAYFTTASEGGGGGRFFTGSPADGFGCNVCHSGSPGQRTFPLHVSGLPGQYMTEMPYEVVLQWPEFAQRWTELRANQATAMAAGTNPPSVGMMAELVAESGAGSGTIEISADPMLQPEQFCEQSNPNISPRLGAKLFQVRAGVEPRELRPDEDGVLRCESKQLAQRCLIALQSCGARQIHFRWIAPPQWEGPIWFSAGFVASEALSNTSQGDSVFETTVAMAQTDSPSGYYEERLGNAGCSLLGARSSASDGSAFGFGYLGLCAALLLRRGKRRSAAC